MLNRKNKNTKKIIPQTPKKLESIPPPASPTPVIVKKSEGNGFLNTLKEGFSFGVGSSIGHKMVDGIFNNKKDIENTQNNKNIIEDTDILYKKYNDCMNNNIKENFDINECIKILEYK